MATAPSLSLTTAIQSQNCLLECWARQVASHPSTHFFCTRLSEQEREVRPYLAMHVADKRMLRGFVLLEPEFFSEISREPLRHFILKSAVGGALFFRNSRTLSRNCCFLRWAPGRNRLDARTRIFL